MNNHYHARSPQPGPACEQFAPLLSLVGQERLDPRESSRLRQHLATCDYCQSELDGYNQLDDLLTRHFGPTPRGPLSPADIRAITTRDYRPRTAPHSNNNHHARRSAPPPRPTRPQPARRGRRVISLLSAIAAVLIIAAVSVALFESRPAPGNEKQTRTTPTPANSYIPRQQDTLNSIFMLSASDGWAVGATSLSTSTSQNLILHYTGGRWTLESGPTNANLRATSSALTQIVMLSASDGWAIGNFLPTNSQTSVGSIFHYTGGHWVLQQTIAHGFLASFSMISPTDGWAVGNFAENSSQLAQSLLLHYDGKTWTRVQAPGEQMTTIAMTSASNGWATGITSGSNGFPGSIVLHYNGTRWVSTSILDVNTVIALSIRSASDGWALGSKDLQNGTQENIFAHYDGKTWTAVQTPITNNENANVNSIFMDSPDDGWAVGHVLSGAVVNPTSTPLYLHYSGGQWTQVNGPDSPWLYSVFMLSASDGWAVGANGTIMHYQNGAWNTTTSAVSATPTPTQQPPINLSPTATSCDTISGPTLPTPGPGTPVPTIPLTTWAVYNADRLFTINYPAGWRSDDGSCGVGHLDVIFTNYDMGQVESPGLPPGAIKIELTLPEAPQSGSALDFWNLIQQADQQAVGGPACPTFTTRQLQVDGRTAVEGGCPALNWDSFIIPDGKNMLDITESAANGVSPSDVLTQMINTLTFPLEARQSSAASLLSLEAVRHCLYAQIGPRNLSAEVR